jgi:hypothetical protein
VRVMQKVTAVPHPADKPAEPPIVSGSGETSGTATGEPLEGGSTSSSPKMSKPSEGPSKPSKRRWQRPKNVKEFAAQANEIATLVLNGEIDMETARGYASLARVVTQSVSIEVNRARLLKREPDLSLE